MKYKNKDFIRVEKYKLLVSEDDFDKYPKNAWTTCVHLMFGKYDKDFSDQKYGFDIQKKAKGILEICLTSEKLKIAK